MERFPSKTHERAFILYQFIAAYLLPVLTISFCYTLMVKRVGQPTVEPIDNNYQVCMWFALFCLLGTNSELFQGGVTRKYMTTS